MINLPIRPYEICCCVEFALNRPQSADPWHKLTDDRAPRQDLQELWNSRRLKGKNLPFNNQENSCKNLTFFLSYKIFRSGKTPTMKQSTTHLSTSILLWPRCLISLSFLLNSFNNFSGHSFSAFYYLNPFPL